MSEAAEINPERDRSIGVREMQTPPGGQRLSHVVILVSGIPPKYLTRPNSITLSYSSRNQLTVSGISTAVEIIGLLLVPHMFLVL